MIARYFRPFRDKLKNFQLGRWLEFFKNQAKESDRPFLLQLPKLGWLLYRGFNFKDFSTYRPLTRSWKEIAAYHSNFDNVRLIGRLNDESKLPLLRDKGAFWKRFSHRMGREFIDLRDASEEQFSQFMTRHPVRVAKPYNLAGGAGIEVLDKAYASDELPVLRQRLLEQRMYVIEEFIQQHEELSRVYPHAVNTLRFITLTTDGVPQLAHPISIRFGSGGGRIDFYGSIIALVDQEGALRSVMCNFGEAVEKHPDTELAFDTVRVPWLREAQQLVLDCAREMPEVRYIGWDVAITPTGPVIVEGNGAPGTSDVQQLIVRDTGFGCRAMLKKLV